MHSRIPAAPAPAKNCKQRAADAIFREKSLNKLLRQKQLNGRGQQHADQQERHGLQHDAEKYGNGRIQFSAKQLPQAKRRTASQRKQQQRRQLRLFQCADNFAAAVAHDLCAGVGAVDRGAQPG